MVKVSGRGERGKKGGGGGGVKACRATRGHHKLGVRRMIVRDGRMSGNVGMNSLRGGILGDLMLLTWSVFILSFADVWRHGDS